MKSIIHAVMFVTISILINSALFAEEDSRDAKGNFLRSSFGLYGHFDRIHVRDSTSAENRTNTILTCLGWGLGYDYGYLSVTLGLRSQLGTSSLDPGYVDDEQLVLTFGIQGKYPIYIGKTLKLFPSIAIEYGNLISGYIRNSENYFPLLVKVGVGSDVEITRGVYIRTVGDISLSPNTVGSFGINKYTTFYSVSEMIGIRIE